MIKKRNRELKETGPSGIENKTKRYAKRHEIHARKFTSPNQRSVPDDLFVTKSGFVFFIEFKSPGKKPTHAQEKEINLLLDHNANVFVVDNLKQPGVDLWRKDFEHNIEIWHDGYALIDHLIMMYD